MKLLPRLSQILEFRFREKSHGRFHTRKVIKIKLFLLTCSGDHQATVVPILRKATHTSCSPLHQSVLYRGQIYNCPCPEKHRRPQNPRRGYRLKISGTSLVCYAPGTSIPICPTCRFYARACKFCFIFDLIPKKIFCQTDVW